MTRLFIIAGREVRDGLRNRWVLATTVLMAALALTLSFLGSAPTGNVGVGPVEVTIVSLSSLTIFLLPLIALLLSFDALVGEFERGTIRKTEWYGEAAFIDAVSDERKSTDGQRFGDTRKVASVPMHVWAREIAPRQRDGNDGSLKRWLNGDKGAPFRTFKGTV